MDTICTERLILRSFTPDDFPAFYAITSDPDTARLAGWGPDPDPVVARAFFLANEVAHPEWCSAICLTDGRVIGAVDAKPPHEWLRAQPRVQGLDGVALSFSIGKSWQNRGYMTEALRALLPVLLASHDYVNCGYFAENAASRAVQDKLGFQLLGLHRFERDGIAHDVVDNIIFPERR